MPRQLSLEAIKKKNTHRQVPAPKEFSHNLGKTGRQGALYPNHRGTISLPHPKLASNPPSLFSLALANPCPLFPLNSGHCKEGREGGGVFPAFLSLFQLQILPLLHPPLPKDGSGSISRHCSNRRKKNQTRHFGCPRSAGDPASSSGWGVSPFLQPPHP